jgi:hypothetical protein
MIPFDIFLSEDPIKQRNELLQMYRNIATQLNGTVKEFTPVMNNATIDAASKGVYFRQGLTCDVWVDILWTAGTGGSIELVLPFKSKRVSGDLWITPVASDSLTLSAGYTYPVLGIAQDSNIATVYECGSGVAMQAVVEATGSIKGLIRFIGQENA